MSVDFRYRGILMARYRGRPHIWFAKKWTTIEGRWCVGDSQTYWSFDSRREAYVFARSLHNAKHPVITRMGVLREQRLVV